MAKFVVSGKVDCAAYARAEMLADRLVARLPDFRVHKIAVPGAEWEEWVCEECDKRGWEKHSGEVLVWRELVTRGGRGVYMGGVREFEDYALHYHNIGPLTDTGTEEKIATENFQTFETHRVETDSRTKPHPLRVVVTAATSPLAYHLVHRLVTGGVLGDQLISLRLLDTPTLSNELTGIAMEITDVASPAVDSVLCTSSSQEAFQSASVVFILDYNDVDKRGEGEEGGVGKGERREEEDGEEGGEGRGESGEMEREREENERRDDRNEEGRDIAAAAKLFHKYGSTLDFYAQKNVRVIVAGRYSNMGAAIIASSATSLPSSHIIASPCLVAQRVKSAIACKLGLNTADVEQLCVWGKCSGKDTVVDVSAVQVKHYPGAIVGPDPFSLPLTHCLHDTTWLTSGVVEEVERRGREERGGGMSEAVAIADMVRDWLESDDKSSVWRPVGVVSDGNCYGFPVGVVCSVPVRREAGEWIIVSDLELTPTIQAQLEAQRDVLARELDLARKHVKIQTSYIVHAYTFVCA